MSARSFTSGAALAGTAFVLAGWQLAIAGSAGGAELALSGVAALAGLAYARALVRRARVPFRPPLRWAWPLARAVPQLAVEAALLGAALVRQLAGGRPVAGAEDEGRVAPRGVDAATAAIAAASFPCLTPNTVVRAVQHRGRVSGRRLLDRDGHRLSDDLARLS